MFELSGVNYEEVLEQGDSILVRVIASSSYRGFELSGLYCTYIATLESLIVTKRVPDLSEATCVYVHLHVYYDGVVRLSSVYKN